jgi:hypothetical protein
MKFKSMFFETALSKCQKEMLKRPKPIRNREVYNLLGMSCSKCGREATVWMSGEHSDKCVCGGKMESVFERVMENLFGQMVSATPETILMDVAYDKVTGAYVACFKAMRLIMEKTADLFGWERFRIDDPQLRDYLDRYFYGRLKGETKIPREEKEVLQFMIRGNLAMIELETAERLISLGVSVVKYGYMYQVLGATGADTLYMNVLSEYTGLYNEINRKIRLSIGEAYVKRGGESIRISKTLGGYYAPCLIVPRRLWESGQISKDLTLEPVYKFPVFPRADKTAIQAAYGPSGSGKTFLLSAIACYGILSKHEMIFSVLNDKTNTFALACMPLFSYSRDTMNLLKLLKETLEIEPQGVPSITITILRRGERVKTIESHPPTIYDRVMEVENPKSFNLDFQAAVDELKAVSEKYGSSRPVGFIGIRNLDRIDSDAKSNVDVQIATNVLNQFDTWRKNHLANPARLFIDEISYLAPSQYAISDAYHSGQSVSDFVKEARRDRVSVDIATQLPLEILPELRNASTNVFFRNLAMSKDKSRSPIDFLLDSLQLKDTSIRVVAREINNRKMLGKGFWFWYHEAAGSLEIIRPCPPTFCIFDPEAKLSPRQIFKRYEKATGEKLLLDSWNDVKPLAGTEDSKRVMRV